MYRIIYLMALLLGIMLPVAVSWSDNHWKSLLPEGDGKDTTAQLCGTMCHNLQKTVVSKKTPKEWEKTVYDMVTRGAQIFPDEAEEIIKYLSKSFPAGQAQAR